MVSLGPYGLSNVIVSFSPLTVNLQAAAQCGPAVTLRDLELGSDVEVERAQERMQRSQGMGDGSVHFLLVQVKGQLGLDVLDVGLADPSGLPRCIRRGERPPAFGRLGDRGLDAKCGEQARGKEFDKSAMNILANFLRCFGTSPSPVGRDASRGAIRRQDTARLGAIALMPCVSCSTLEGKSRSTGRSGGFLPVGAAGAIVRLVSGPSIIDPLSSRLHESLRLCACDISVRSGPRSPIRRRTRRRSSGFSISLPTAISCFSPSSVLQVTRVLICSARSAILDAGLQAAASPGPRHDAPAAACGGRRADTAGQLPVQCGRGRVARRDSGNRAQAEPAQLQGVLRAPLVSSGQRDGGPATSTCRTRVPFGIDLLFRMCRGSTAFRGGRGHRDLRGPLGADPAQLGPGDGRGRRCCSTPRPATRRSARASTARDLVVGQSGRCIAAYAMPARGRRNRRPIWSSAAIA